MAVFSKVILLMHQHVDKGLLVLFFFQLPEHRLLRLRHRTADAMALAPELADTDAGGRDFAHAMT